MLMFAARGYATTQRRRHRDLTRRLRPVTRAPRAVVQRDQPRLLRETQSLNDTQRNSVARLSQGVNEVLHFRHVRPHATAANRIDHGVGTKWWQRQHGECRMIERRGFGRACGTHHQQWQLTEPSNDDREELSRRRIGPMQVIQQQCQRFLFGDRRQQIEQRQRTTAHRLAALVGRRRHGIAAAKRRVE